MSNANAASVLRTLNEGVREVVSKERALEFITEWDRQFDEQSADGVTTIVLAGKSYKPDAAEILMEYFKTKRSQELSMVKEIDISDIIASLPEEEGLATLKLICDGLTEVCGSSLEKLDLSDNAMGLKGINACQAFYNTPTACPKLHTLRFCNLGLAEASMEELIMYLSKEDASAPSNSSIASRLQRIEFTKNMSGDGGCYAFAKLVSKADPFLLSYLNFSGTRASRKGTMAVITALKQRMIDENDMEGKLWNITHLNFNDNAFGGNVGEGGELLVEILRHCPNLEYLNIHDNFLDGPTITIQHVCDALLESQCPLQFLDVGANEVTYEIVKRGLIPLLKAKSSTLTTLLAETNEMTSRGVERIAKTIEGLGSDCVLEEINFNFNMVGGQGASAWTQLKHSGKCPPSLKKLHLDGNMIPEEHARALEDAFGDILVEMTENEPEEDADDDLSELDESESDNDEDGVVIGGMDIIHQADIDENKEPVETDTPAEEAAVDDLAAAMEKTNI